MGDSGEGTPRAEDSPRPADSVTGEVEEERTHVFRPDLAQTQLPPDARHTPADDPSLPRGAALGRFLVVDIIGAGGMGVVYHGYDPRLDRKVAIKVMRPDLEGPSADQVQSRLVREAKAMAKLSHPNVVTVYEAGRVEDVVYIAMEYVAGTTLTAWLGERRRPLRQILDVMVRAGQGLSAAHKAGVIHRDFKPDNVLIGDDGRVHVTDFGLAVRRSSREQTRAGAAPAVAGAADGPTERGAIMGTPRYAAPERFLGRRATDRSDQFSFCVTLHEAACGQPPFEADTVNELAHLVVEGRRAPLPRDHRVPRWLQRVIDRGLSTGPGDRYDSMEALLDRLARRPGRTRIGVAAAAVAVLGGAGGVAVLGGEDEAAVCRGASERLAGIWDAERKQAAEKAFLATKAPFAERAWDSAHQIVDDYTDDWVSMHEQACRATHVWEKQSQEFLDIRMLCLERRLHEVRALSKAYSSPSSEVIEHATEAALSLKPVADCGDQEILREMRRVAEPEDENLQRLLAKARVHLSSGRFEDGLGVARDTVKAARGEKHRPTEAEALFVLGQLQWRVGELQASEETLRQGALVAESTAQDRLRAEMLIELIYVVGWEQARYRDGLLWAERADALLERLGEHKLLRARLLVNEGILYGRSGPDQEDIDESIAHLEKSLAIRLDVLGEEHVDTAFALHTLGSAHLYDEAYDRAEEYLSRGRDIREALLGNSHPDYADSLNNLGHAYFGRGDAKGALDLYRRALEIWRTSEGPEHPDVGIALANIGNAHAALGNDANAIEHYERALPIEEAARGPDHPDVATTLLKIGSTYLRLGQPARAIESLERTIAIREQRDLGGQTKAEFLLAQALWSSGRDRGRALALAAKVRDTYATAGRQWQTELARVDDWLAARR